MGLVIVLVFGSNISNFVLSAKKLDGSNYAIWTSNISPWISTQGYKNHFTINVDFATTTNCSKREKSVAHKMENNSPDTCSSGKGLRNCDLEWMDNLWTLSTRLLWAIQKSIRRIWEQGLQFQNKKTKFGRHQSERMNVKIKYRCFRVFCVTNKN